MKASIIIPAYNAVSLLPRAILSVTETPPPFDYEILVIDDGSKDDTASVTRSLAEKNAAIRLISQENAGPAAARNRGILEARGEYILFLDSDDSFYPNAVEKAVLAAEKENATLLIFGFSVVNEKGEVPYGYPDARLFTTEEKKKHLAPLYGTNMLNQVWGKVFRRDFLVKEKILFPHTRWGEDRLFFFTALEKAERILVMKESLYRYIQQKDSLISRFQKDKGDICLLIHQRITALAEGFGPLTEEEEKIFSYMYIKSLLSVFATLYAPSARLSGKEKRAFVKGVLSQEAISKVKDFPDTCGRSFRILAAVVKTRSVNLNLFAAFGVRLLSRLLPEVFRRAKHALNEEKGK